MYDVLMITFMQNVYTYYGQQGCLFMTCRDELNPYTSTGITPNSNDSISMIPNPNNSIGMKPNPASSY